MRTKQVILKKFFNDTDYDIIILVETWLHEEITDEELNIYNFSIFRTDRPTRGGGVLIAIRRPILCHLLNSVSNIFEGLFIKCCYQNTLLILGSFYIPPTAGPMSYSDMCLFIEQTLNSHIDSKFLIVGDFNLPHIQWTVDECSYSFDNTTTPSTLSSAETLSETMSLFTLTQHNHINNISGNTLDLVFSSFGFIDVSLDLDTYFKIDNYHPPLSFEIPINTSDSMCSKKSFSYYNFAAADYNQITFELNSVNWNDLFLDTDINTSALLLSDFLNELIVTYVPLKTVTIDSFPPWFDSHIKKLITDKKRLIYSIKRPDFSEIILSSRSLELMSNVSQSGHY